MKARGARNRRGEGVQPARKVAVRNAIVLDAAHQRSRAAATTKTPSLPPVVSSKKLFPMKGNKDATTAILFFFFAA